MTTISEPRDQSVFHQISRYVRSGTVIVVITLLIWFAADQGVMTEEPIGVSVVFTSQNPDVYVGLTQPPAQREYKITIKGRRRRITELKSLLAVQSPLEIRSDETRGPRSEPYQLSVRDDLLRNVQVIRQTGSITKCTPSEESLRIDSYVDIKDIPVRVDFGDLRVSRTLSHNTITARVPSFVAADKSFADNVEAVINASDYVNEQTPGFAFEFEGKPTLSGLSKLFVAGSAIQITPGTVTVTGRIETLQAVESKGPITIRWSIPDQVQQNYRVVAEDAEFIIFVDVSGPRERVAAMEANQIRAFVDIFARDLNDPGPGKTITRDVRYYLPIDAVGCRITEETAKRQVRFRLEPITKEAGLPTNGADSDGES